MTRSLAIITGASTGIGFELAKCAAEDGHDLLICANEPQIETAKADLAAFDVSVEALQADLGTKQGVAALVSAIGGRDVALLLANAGRGLGDGFLDQNFEEAKNVVDTNVTGTISLIHNVGRGMRARNAGRILITGSIAGFIPGSFQAVYNGSKAFLDSFSWALANELKETDVTVTCLMPGPTDTEFFRRAKMEDTDVGRDDDKDDAGKVARQGYDALMKGERGVVAGSFMNKVQATFAGIIPDSILAEMHRKMAVPDDRKDG